MAETDNDIEAITHAWEAALAAHDVEALLACYHPDAVLESPVVAHVQGPPGVCRGREQLRGVLTEVLSRTPEVRQYHRAGFFTDGRRAMWEYPRESPSGEQMDFVEVMDVEDGLIRSHRVYWGWKGVDVLLADGYHRA